MQGQRCGDDERASVEGSCRYLRIGASPYLRQSTGEVAQGENVSETHDGVKIYQPGVRGLAHVGTALLCGKFGQCYGRGHHQIH